MTQDESLRRLRNGESVDVICNEFTEMVNAAEKEYNDEKSKRQKIKKSFNEECNICANAMNSAVEYYKQMNDNCVGLNGFKWTAEDVKKVIETTADVATITNKFIKGSAEAEQDFEQVIHKFFKKYGIE